MRERLVPAAEPPAAAASVGRLDVEPPAAAPALGFEEKESWVDNGRDNRAAKDRHEVLETLASFYEFLRGDWTTFLCKQDRDIQKFLR